MQYEKSDKALNCIYETDSYLIFGTFSLYKQYEEANSIMHDIAKNIKAKENIYFCGKGK